MHLYHTIHQMEIKLNLQLCDRDGLTVYFPPILEGGVGVGRVLLCSTNEFYILRRSLLFAWISKMLTKQAGK